MLILKYFLTVGLTLTAGLFVLSAYIESENTARAARTYAVHAVLPAPAAAPLESDLDVMVGPVKPDPILKASSSTSRRSGHHRSR